MAKFSKNNFIMIIHEIEDMEAADQNIWVPIGILEIMYDDYAGIIDRYFHSKDRDIEKLWEDLDGFPLGPETKKALKDLSNKLWREDYQKEPINLTPKITWKRDGNKYIS